MKSWVMELLGVGPEESSARHVPGSVRRIVESLEALEPERAHFLAAFAFLLGRVAHADLDISAEERREMEKIIERFGDLPADQSRLVVEIVQHEQHHHGSTQGFQVAREFHRLANRDEERELLDCLFAVSAADGSISGIEEKHIRQIAEELNFSHREYIEARSGWNDQRSVMKRLAGES